MYAAGPPYCPTCGRLDQVRKASALYDAGTRFSPEHRYTWSALALRMQPGTAVSTPTRLDVSGAAARPTAVARRHLCNHRRDPRDDRHRAPAGRYRLPARRGPALIALGVGTTWPLAHWLEHWAYAVQCALFVAELRSWEDRFYCLRCDDTFVPVPPALAGSYTGQTIRVAP